ncbi:MAG: M20/M25/M40 family metallo-hydrolase [Candidatus Marinimicrobia bacterium]|nr:M20/M25/M40 family metallo-hydrolase [Candidatus Neomarinimicrobiota bacterium]MCF7880254.1 M20/M25/M40 family metallo-hydrolase [Candidatus Neomarinimicrobiota bacterium]
MDVIDLARDFIRIESISENEAPFAGYLQSFFDGHGWETERTQITDDRWNLLTKPSRDAEPEIYFCSHLDTVAPFVEFSEDDDYLYGRGACDTKGVIAAMIGAAFQLVHSGTDNIGFLFTVGEEIDSIGAKVENENPPDGVEYLIVGEPTENRLVAGQKGIYIVEITAEGKSAHSAYPELGDSAVEKLLNILERLRETTLPSHPELGDTTVNISNLYGGDRYNVIPNEAGASLLFRVSTSLANVKTIVRNAVNGEGTVKEISQCEPQQMMNIPGYENEIVAFSTDIPFLGNWGTPLLLGPGSIHDAHTQEEKIEKSEILEAVEKYMDIVEYLNDHMES